MFFNSSLLNKTVAENEKVFLKFLGGNKFEDCHNDLYLNDCRHYARKNLVSHETVAEFVEACKSKDLSNAIVLFQYVTYERIGWDKIGTVAGNINAIASTKDNMYDYFQDVFESLQGDSVALWIDSLSNDLALSQNELHSLKPRIFA